MVAFNLIRIFLNIIEMSKMDAVCESLRITIRSDAKFPD